LFVKVTVSPALTVAVVGLNAKFCSVIVVPLAAAPPPDDVLAGVLVPVDVLPEQPAKTSIASTDKQTAARPR
jgi:hypothetical protein